MLTDDDRDRFPRASSSARARRYEPVEGHAYAEITSGKREGMFVNTSGNVRNGEAFVLVRKNGKEYHIYGTGKDRLVVGFHMPGANHARRHHRSAGSTGSTGSTRARLPIPTISSCARARRSSRSRATRYAEIVSGPRSGMYINTSGNSRRGEAFVLVEKADFNYHIYGSGDDRRSSARTSAT